jgi:archaellum biogenesis ATPase FlaH
MANVKIEGQFIRSILDRRIDPKIFEQFDIRQLEIYYDLYEWLEVYWQQHHQLPSVELVKTRFPEFIEPEVVDDPQQIVEALRKNAEYELFNRDLAAGLQVLKNTGDVKKAREFLLEKLERGIQEEDDVFELTNSDFTIGRDDFQARKEAVRTNTIVGIPTGLGIEFDQYLGGGWQNGNLYGVTGITGIGKSWIATVIAAAALQNKYNPFYLALEGNIIREYYRALSVLTGVENDEIRSGKLLQESFDNAEQMMRRIAKDNNSKFWLGIFGRREKYTPRILRQKIVRYKPDLTIVDYWTLMSANQTSQSDWKEFLDISRDLAAIAKSEQVPIVGILQGTIQSLGAKELTIEDIASSKGIARDFDEVIGLTRVPGKEYWLKINTMKTRDSSTGKFAAYYNTNWNTGKIKFQTFADQDDDVL